MSSKFIGIVVLCYFIFSCIDKKDNNPTSKILNRVSVCENFDYTFKNGKVYFLDTFLIEGVDVNSFTCLNEEYAKDKNYVYFGEKRFEIADVKTFEFLGYHYSKDKNHVYFDAYLGGIVEDVDPQTFEVIDHNFSKDKNYVYDQIEMDGLKKMKHLNPKTFRPLGTECYQDERFFYSVTGEVLGELEQFDEAYIKDLCGN